MAKCTAALPPGDGLTERIPACLVLVESLGSPDSVSTEQTSHWLFRMVMVKCSVDAGSDAGLGWVASKLLHKAIDRWGWPLGPDTSGQ